ncbi:MAG: VTT domain-containing protein [Hyphomicrobiales bacterium]|nr:VTT domain-containing protein [Hyphomicrobiales bacterium]
MNSPGAPKQTKCKLIVFILAAIFLTTLAWYFHNYVSLEELASQESRLREAIAINPWRSFAIGFCIYTVVALIPGTGGKAIVYGWIFGFWQAVAIVTVGLAIAAIAIFWLSRYLVRERIERRFPRFLTFINRNLEKDVAFYLVTLRLLHAPYSIVNPVIGASRVPTWTFLWTTIVGLLPANAVWVYVGIHLPSLRELADHGAESFISLPLISALVLCGTLPFLMRWLINRYGFPGVKGQGHDAAFYQSQKKDP